MGKLTKFLWPFSIAMLNYQMVTFKLWEITFSSSEISRAPAEAVPAGLFVGIDVVGSGSSDSNGTKIRDFDVFFL